MLASPKRSALLSGLLHGGAIALVLLVTTVKTPTLDPPRNHTPGRDIRNYISLVPRRSEGGGGGGAREETRASKGMLLRASLRPFAPPVVRLLNENPRITMEAAILASPDTLPPVPDGAVWGDPNGVLGKLSSGPGAGSGIGDGCCGGVGPGKGPGAGPGQSPVGGISGQSGLTGIVTRPVLLTKAEPEYTEEARRAKVQGMVVLRVEVNERGGTQNISILRSLGLGLDERAVEAVQRWKFRAGQLNGKPTVTVAIIEVSFRLL